MDVAEYPSSLKSSPSSLLALHPFLPSSASHPSSSAAAPSPGDSVADRGVAGVSVSAGSGGGGGAWGSAGISSGMEEGEGVLVAGEPDQGGVAESGRGTVSSGHVEVWGEGGSGLRDVFGIIDIVSGGSQWGRRKSFVWLVACMEDRARVASEPDVGQKDVRLGGSRRGLECLTVRCDGVALGPLVSRERRRAEESWT